MGSIKSPSDGTGRRDPYPNFFIQCINGQELMDNKLWSHGLDGISRDIHPTAQVEIPPETE